MNAIMKTSRRWLIIRCRHQISKSVNRALRFSFGCPTKLLLTGNCGDGELAAVAGRFGFQILMRSVCTTLGRSKAGL